MSLLAVPLSSQGDIRAEIARRAKARERERVERDQDAIRARCTTLAGFIREAWHVVEPANPYVHGWHIDAICAHLVAVSDGELNRLLMNVPPGTMKSLLSSVLWPAWEWGPLGRPATRYISTSYAEHFVTRDTRRMRDLVLSDWYQTLFPHVRLTRAGEASFANEATGFRDGMPFGSLTGGRADRVIVDDPHSTETAESDTERKRVTRIFREQLPSRMVEPRSSAIVIIMQRLHTEDVSGQALALNLGYTHLCLPMEFEPDRRCVTRWYRDPRTYDGELLFPERFPRDVVERDKVPMGSYAVAGQFQQRPVPREGGMFKRAWFEGRVVTAAPADCEWVRHWDLAASTKATSPFTAGVKMGRSPEGRYYVAHVKRERAEGHEVRRIIKGTAEVDGHDVEISLPQDPGQAGKVQKADMIAMLAGYVARAEIETGDKVQRAEPFAAQCEAGNVYLVKGADGSWIEPYLDELCNFPGGTFKDQVDASSGAFGRLVRDAPDDDRIGGAVQAGAAPRERI